jgi:hypothetical protein
MPKLVLPLTDLRVKSAKPREKLYKLSDGGGLFLEVTPLGRKYWRMSYTQTYHKKTRLSFGAYPVVSLADAREKSLNARKLIANDIDPAAARRATKYNRNVANANTFEVIAREWHAHMKSSWKESTSKNVLQRLVHGLLRIDDYPFTNLCTLHLLTLRRIKPPIHLRRNSETSTPGVPTSLIPLTSSDVIAHPNFDPRMRSMPPPQILTSISPVRC